MLMQFLRRLGLSLSASLFSLTIFMFAAFISVYVVLDTPKQLEAALQQSGIYNGAVQSALQQSENSNSSLPLSDPGVQAAIQSAVPASTVQASTEQIINSMYGWIHGTTASPHFSIDLTPLKANIADNLGNYLQQKLESLPLCPPGTPIPDNTAEALSMSCRPAVMPIDKLVAQAEQTARGDGVLKDSAITASSLKDGGGQQLTNKFSYVPRFHRYFILSLFVLPAVMLLSALAVIFMSKSKRAGGRRLCFILMTTGIYGIAASLLAAWMLNHASNSIGSQAAGLEAVQGKVVTAIGLVVTVLRKWWLGFGIGYVLLGVIGLLALHFTKPKLGVVPAGNPLGHNKDIPQAGMTFAPKDGDEPAPTIADTPSSSHEPAATTPPQSHPDPKPAQPLPSLGPETAHPGQTTAAGVESSNHPQQKPPNNHSATD